MKITYKMVKPMNVRLSVSKDRDTASISKLSTC